MLLDNEVRLMFSLGSTVDLLTINDSNILRRQASELSKGTVGCGKDYIGRLD
jgi:hypothetical protein